MLAGTHVNNGIIFQYGKFHIQAQDQWTTSFNYNLSYTEQCYLWFYPNSSIHLRTMNQTLTSVSLECWERTAGGYAITDDAYWYSIGI